MANQLVADLTTLRKERNPNVTLGFSMKYSDSHKLFTSVMNTD